jgi:hypothetical protein
MAVASALLIARERQRSRRTQGTLMMRRKDLREMSTANRHEEV